MTGDWSDDRYARAVTAMLSILDAMDRQTMKRHELAGVIVAAVLEALSSWEAEYAAQQQCTGRSAGPPYRDQDGPAVRVDHTGGVAGRRSD